MYSSSLRSQISLFKRFSSRCFSRTPTIILWHGRGRPIPPSPPGGRSVNHALTQPWTTSNSGSRCYPGHEEVGVKLADDGQQHLLRHAVDDEPVHRRHLLAEEG
jgi:hypothetical protein